MDTAKMTLISAILLLVGCDQQQNSISTERSQPPLLLAINAMEEDFQSELTKVTISQYVHGESPNSAIVEIEEKGLFDDSIEAEKTIFTFFNRNGKWVIEHKSKQQKCYNGRGHQDYSVLPCD